MRKISVYFGVPESDFFLATEAFQRRYASTTKSLSGTPLDILSAAFADQDRSLRNYLGIYQTYVISPSWEDKVLCSLTQLSIRQGYVIARTVQPAVSRDEEKSRRTRFDGLATYRGNRIYVVEIEEGKDTSLVETILYPTHRQQVNYLRGVTLGVASQPRLTPYSSKTIWRRVPDRITAREALQDCGISDISSRKVGHTIREYLGAET
jgi:hypothetical protein